MGLIVNLTNRAQQSRLATSFKFQNHAGKILTLERETKNKETPFWQIKDGLNNSLLNLFHNAPLPP